LEYRIETDRLSFGESNFDSDTRARDIDDGHQQSWRLWVEQPNRRRVQFGLGEHAIEVIWVEDVWSRLTHEGRLEATSSQHKHPHEKGPSEFLLDPAPFLGALTIEILQRDVFLGRPTYQLRAKQRSLALVRLFLHHVGPGADEFLLSVDIERGVLLRCEARLRNRPFRIIAMTEVVFDAPLPRGTFSIPAD
jgi:hypothetical protein